MLEELHQHMVSELQQGARTDTVFVVSAVVFNLVVLGINWGVASAAAHRPATGGNDAILVLLILATLAINFFSVRALRAGSVTRRRLIAGLIAMYEDEGVAKYYDPSLLDIYGARYRLFIAVLAVLAAIAIVVPLLERFM